MGKHFSLFILILVFSCTDRQGSLFHYVAAEDSGLDFINSVEETQDLNILDYLYFYNGGGVAIGDVNNDGLPDIFLSANQEKNKLYINKGRLKFEDVSEKAGVEGNSDWNTGASMVDINADGWLDIYVTAVVGIMGFDGHNELYINNQDGTFTESSAAYQLDFDTYSSSAAFLDYDLDGDLDMYLLNHAVHTQNAFGKAEIRNQRNYETGDRLLRNDGNIFVDVSEEAGIFGGVNGYGLGVSVADFNQDGYPDIYVGNDFHEDDYYYLNQKDGTFKESLKSYFGHTTRFSMGTDVGDINNDGWPDLMSLDMLPEDEKVLKSSEGDDSYQTMKMRTEGYGYHYQYTRNMLYINQPGYVFAETALQSGIAATDWSWSTLIEDFNQDGHLDVFISNGIPKRPNDLDFIKFVSSEQIQNKINETKLVDQEALSLMPSGKVSNYIFEGKGGVAFDDRSGEWIRKDTLVSGATAFGDLDLDGDLDLVINNLNSTVSLLENKTDASANYLNLVFDFSDKNPFGIGTEVTAFVNGKLMHKSLYTNRGFQSSSEPLIHFGLGTDEVVDSLRIVWPDQTYQVLREVKANQKLRIQQENVTEFYRNSLVDQHQIFTRLDDTKGLRFEHVEDAYLDFNRQKLIPYQFSTDGPAVAVGDWNKDGMDDVFFGGSKYKPSALYIQNENGFSEGTPKEILADSIVEDVSAIMTDLDSDGSNDLFIVSGGADFFGKSAPLLDNYYLRDQDSVVKKTVDNLYENGSIVAAYDYDQDGDIDLFIGNRMVTNDYGKIPPSYILVNVEGEFTKLETDVFDNLGMITDAVWSDFDQDGVKDLVVVGEWMKPRFFKNEKGTLTETVRLPNELNGLWQAVLEFDIDHDGDPDYMLGNWGLNSKYRATKSGPLRMYYGDFDKNGATETIVANWLVDDYYPINSFDELSSQMVSLRKTFNSYKDFAGLPMEGIFPEEVLTEVTVFEVSQLASGFLRNTNGSFEFVAFSEDLQLSPILDFLAHDFDEDGQEELICGGNFLGVTPYHGRFDSFSGALIQDEQTYQLGYEIGLDFALKSLRHLDLLQVADKTYLLVTFNDDKIQLYSFR